jgi:hypothetical protein
MSYAKTNWIPPEGQYLNRWTKQNETATSVELIRNPVLSNSPTPFSAENMNRIEQGIFEAHRLIQELSDEQPFGYLIPFAFEPPAYLLSKWRCLYLGGQMALISNYQRLCDAKYVGDAANATADWWYKTADQEGTIRDPNGAWMRILDHRGLFIRPAGQNSLYKMANDAPYDGMSIGEHIGDAIRNIFGNIGLIGSYPENPTGAIGTWGPFDTIARGSDIAMQVMFLDASLLVPTALENRPASISAYLCIKY